MRIIYLSILLMLGVKYQTLAQELFIFTDPASNVPAKAMTFRLNSMLMPMGKMDIALPYPDMEDPYKNQVSTRVSADVSYGVNKNLMFKLSGYGSDMMQEAFRFEGVSLYSKVRFLSHDDFHKHFRMAAFGKIALNGNPYRMQKSVVHNQLDGSGGTVVHEVNLSHSSDEQNLEGNHGGWMAGVVATQLIHKLALSGTGSIVQRWNNGKQIVLPNDEKTAFQYSFSAGYLLFPKQYESYGQTNLNLYAEWIGQKAWSKFSGFLDFAPGVQVIFNSKIRIDAAFRFQVAGSMKRFNHETGLIRFEYNWLR